MIFLKLPAWRGVACAVLLTMLGAAGAQTAEVQPVGKAPVPDNRPPEVAPIFEQPGVLTPRGRYVLEPSVQFGYSSSNRVALSMPPRRSTSMAIWPLV